MEERALEKPAAREAIAQASRKAQATIERHAERARHRLLLDDGILSSHGVRPWEQDANSP
jgi:DNA-binding GntR family transcriptional regulator